ncbi:MAG: zinc ABC transporter substrate-binding protein [Halocynthiibacter sp.]
MPNHFTSLIAMSASLMAAPTYAANVVTDIAPVHGLVSMVMEGAGQPTLLVTQTASPHHFSLKPSQARDLERADVVFYVGEALSPWIEAPLSALAGNAAKVSLMEAKGVTTHSFRDTALLKNDNDDHDGHEDHDKHDDHDGHDKHDDHDTHGEDKHHDDHHDEDAHMDHHDHDHHGQVDPHLWLDPMNAILWLDTIADTLSKADPEHADLYHANAKKAVGSLTQQTTELSASLGALSNMGYVVQHDAYQYFEARFGLHPIGSISLSDATKPSAKRLSTLKAKLKSANISCAFKEPQMSHKLLNVVLPKDTRIVDLDPIGAAIPLGVQFYPQFLDSLNTAFVTCASDAVK